MKLHILSDIHLENAPFQAPQTDADVVLLAGDIAEGVAGVTWAIDKFQVPVVYVCGNHEFHDSDSTMIEHLDAIKDAASGSNVIVLDNEETVIGGVRFLASTMWTDLSNFGSVLYCDHDYIIVEYSPGSAPTHFSVEHQQQYFEKNRAWLRSALQRPFDGKTVVVTHHAPSLKSLHPQYMNNPWTPCFITDMEALMPGIDLWVHGHTHNCFDYHIGNTRVVCNPRGNPNSLGGWENRMFNPAMVVEL
ncbi:metallophosphoesterase [Mariprofundus sp. KV]|uniref:metallophosphoesterase n=1 Tax=Mariprofundus sp. KV TaxID=2608715 RepID=UPI0015A0CE9C|nr:metallophosphoesterase [Mariprofundus sp. KV]NWF36184.1 phosphoesterase [Mariprofundus sp. KV]